MARKELDGRWGGRPVESGQGSASSVALEPGLLPQTQLLMWGLPSPSDWAPKTLFLLLDQAHRK